jgi:hypothetical protein
MIRDLVSFFQVFRYFYVHKPLKKECVISERVLEITDNVYFCLKF